MNFWVTKKYLQMGSHSLRAQNLKIILFGIWDPIGLQHNELLRHKLTPVRLVSTEQTMGLLWSSQINKKRQKI